MDSYWITPVYGGRDINDFYYVWRDDGTIDEYDSFESMFPSRQYRRGEAPDWLNPRNKGRFKHTSHIHVGGKAKCQRNETIVQSSPDDGNLATFKDKRK